MKHYEICQLIRKLGFLNVRLYEDIGQGAFYDAITPDGRKVEVTFSESEKQLVWRELHPKNIEWFTINIEEYLDSHKKEAVIKTEQLTLVI